MSERGGSSAALAIVQRWQESIAVASLPDNVCRENKRVPKANPSNVWWISSRWRTTCGFVRSERSSGILAALRGLRAITYLLFAAKHNVPC